MIVLIIFLKKIREMLVIKEIFLNIITKNNLIN